MSRYTAKWRYGRQCLRAGEIKAECEANSLPEFAQALCREYAYGLGDDFCFAIWGTFEQFVDAWGDDPADWPAWAREANIADNEVWPIYEFTSSFGTELLCHPSASKIITQIADESYGDYDLVITGI